MSSRADLNRWFEESDLEVEELAESVIQALEDWLGRRSSRL
jgi:hypothetical protein